MKCESAYVSLRFILYIQDGGRVSLPSVETLYNRLPDVVFQNRVIFRKFAVRMSNKNVLLLLSVYETFRSEVKTGFLHAQISCPTTLLVIELPFYFTIGIRNRTCSISKYSAVAAVKTCIQNVPYSSLDQANSCHIYRFLLFLSASR